MRNSKKLKMIITAAWMAVAAVATSGTSAKAIAMFPVETRMEETGVMTSRSTLTKQTENRAIIKINGVDMLSIVQYGTWVYGGATGNYPTLPVYQTNVTRMASADGTCVWSLGSASIAQRNNGSWTGTRYTQNINVSLNGKNSKSVSISTTFYSDGNYEFSCYPTTLNF